MKIYTFSAPSSAPASFGTWENKWLFGVNGTDRPMFWDPVGYPSGAVKAGITAPATKETLTAIGSGGPITGTYTAYYRFVDAGGRVSDFSPVSSTITASSAQYMQHVVAPSPAAEPRVTGIQVYRNTDGQVSVYYLVGTLPPTGGTITESNSDTQLQALPNVPISNPDGTPFANMNGVPPSNAIAFAGYQDRSFWLLDDDEGTIMYSAAALPESVLATNTVLVLQGDRDDDAPTGLMVLHSFLYLLRERHIYQLTYAVSPVYLNVGAAVNRGCLNQNCWVLAGTGDIALLMDAQGIYEFGGFVPEDIGAPVQDYFRNGTIDMSKSQWFHASFEPQTRIARFHVSFQGETRPKHALCYSLATKCWWVESYAEEMGGACLVSINGVQRLLLGGQTQIWRYGVGLTDNGQPVNWSYATPLLVMVPIEGGVNHEARVVFMPTSGASTMEMQLFTNHDTSPQNFYGPYNLGDGVTVPTTGNTVTVNMQATRSPLSTAPGFERLGFAGQFDDRTQGTRWTKVRLEGSQQTDAITIYGLEFVGAG